MNVGRIDPFDHNSPAYSRLLIVGGSTRAAAGSARRASFQPVCADLFADMDLFELAEVLPVRDFPESLPEDVAGSACPYWIYTGGLENSPELVDRLASRLTPGTLLGTGRGLHDVRNPFVIVECLGRAGVLTLAVRPDDNPPPADGHWIWKPLRSAGGRAVRIWDAAAASSPEAEPGYFQERAQGTPVSALFFTQSGALELLGLTAPLGDEFDCRAPEPFSYRGSIGPASISTNPEFAARLRVMAEALIPLGLQGLFGLDLIAGLDGLPRLLEINPRYPASLELLELAQGRSLLFGARPAEAAPRACVAKAILYANRDCQAPDLRSGITVPSVWDVPVIADCPQPGATIPRGWPVCSVMASGTNESACLSQLRDRVDRVWQMFDDRGISARFDVIDPGLNATQ